MASHRQQIIFKVYFYLPERNIKYFDKTELLCCLFKILLTISSGQPWPGPAPAVSDWFKTYFLPLNSSTLDTASHNIFSAYFTRKKKLYRSKSYRQKCLKYVYDWKLMWSWFAVFAQLPIRVHSHYHI